MVTIFPSSNEQKKIAFSKKNYGVCHVMLIDKLIEGDMAMLDLLDLVEPSASDESSDDIDTESSSSTK